MGPQTFDLPQYIAAVGALGTAAYGLVDASKLAMGGPSNHGFGFVRYLISKRLFPSQHAKGSGFLVSDLLNILRANWLNGVALDDQKSKAKGLIKLMLNSATYSDLAKATGIKETQLQVVASKMVAAQPLTDIEKDTLGRFDLTLTALLDEAYQRADQQYRNSAKGWATVVSVILAVLGAWLLYTQKFAGPPPPAGPVPVFWSWSDTDLWAGVITGLLATPLAPVAKDLSSALTASMRAVQFKIK